MNYDEQGIQELIAMDEQAARERVVHAADIKKQINEIKKGLDSLDISKTWADVWDCFGCVNLDFDSLTSMFSAIDRGLKIRAAAIEAKKITDAGFDFDQIGIDGIRLYRTPEGICENGFYNEMENIPF